MEPSDNIVRENVSQNGSNKKKILLTLLIIILVGGLFGGVYAFQQNKLNEVQTELDDANEKIDKLSSKNDTEVKDPAATNEVRYLDIKEEGIKIKLSTLIEDAYYSVNQEGLVAFGVRSLDKLSACKPRTVNLGGMDQWQGVANLSFDKYGTGFRTDQKPEQSGFRDNANAVRVGNNWYKIEIQGPDDCKSTDLSVQAKIEGVQDAFLEASKSISKL